MTKYGILTSKRVTKGSHRNAILLAAYGTSIEKIGGEQNESKTATFLHTLGEMETNMMKQSQTK